MSTIIGLKQLRENTEEIIERAKRGESFTVIRRSKPIFELKPVDTGNAELGLWLDEYIAHNRQLLESLADK